LETSITGLQVMPSIAWFPLAILVFGLNEQAILFVVVLGAGPSIANGVIAGIDHVPPAFTRLGRVLGRAPSRSIGHRPSGRPPYVRRGTCSGLVVCLAKPDGGRTSRHHCRDAVAGTTLDFARQMSKVPELIATMIVILLIGMLVDTHFWHDFPQNPSRSRARD